MDQFVFINHRPRKCRIWTAKRQKYRVPTIDTRWKITSLLVMEIFQYIDLSCTFMSCCCLVFFFL